MIGSYLSQFVRNKSNLSRLIGQNQVNKLLFPAVPFNIKLSNNLFLDLVDITVGNMPFVRTRVNSNSLGAKALAGQSRIKHIRMIAAPGISQGGNFIDIYRKLGCHALLSSGNDQA